MGLLDILKNKTNDNEDFSFVNEEKILNELVEQGKLKPLYLIPLRFKGDESEKNRIFIPDFAVELKERYDDQVEVLLFSERVDGYDCIPKFEKGGLVPSSLLLIAKKDGEIVFTQVVDIW